MIINQNKKNKYKLAFTLAEVLITLGVIGVVAALTIPTLITNYQKHQTVTQLQKAYSQINQAFLNAKLEMGDSAQWSKPVVNQDPIESLDWWNTYFLPNAKLSTSKTCVDDNFYECISNTSKYLDGTTMGWTTNLPAILLNDGSVIKLGSVSNTANASATIWVDLNGKQKPNIVGKDLFLIQFYLQNGLTVLSGYPTTKDVLLQDGSARCNKNTGSSKGTSCGYIIQQDGWQIKDDYPW